MAQKDDVNLPRGLITRRGGLQMITSERLPSLRCDPISKSSPSNALPTTTKGGVAKRTFKPTIPSRRPTSEKIPCEESAKPASGKRGGRQTRGSNKGKLPYNESKKFMQMEAAVFSGQHHGSTSRGSSGSSGSMTSRSTNSQTNSQTSTISSLSSTSLKRGSDKLEDDSSDFEKSSPHVDRKIKLEHKTGGLIRKLYGDNFIDDEEEDEDLLVPKGWETVSGHRHFKNKSSPPLTPYNLLTTDADDKFILMQLPEMLLQRQGLVGKLRVYKSGKIELEDNESGIKFDLVMGTNHASLLNVKSENKKFKPNLGPQELEVSQDVVSLSGDNLSVLGPLNRTQSLVAVPQIPLEEHIGHKFPI